MGDEAVAIVGVGNTPYLRQHEKNVAALMVEAGRAALADSGLAPEGVDGIITPRGMPAADELAFACGLRQRNYTCINAYTPGAGPVAALVEARLAIQAGLCKAVLVLYGLKVSTPGGPYAYHAEDPLKADLEMPVGYYGQPLYFAAMAERYRYQYGLDEAHLGAVAVAQRAWAQRTPGSQRADALALEDYLAAPYIAEPLRSADCCLISDGAGAYVVTSVERARDLPRRPVTVRGIAASSNPWTLTEMFTQSPDFLELGPGRVAGRAFAEAGIGHGDVDFVQIYDCFSLSVILQIESLGFCRRGEGAIFMSEGGRTAPGGALPVNTDGGHLSHGYIPGMTHVLEAVRQLRGERGAGQVKGAEVGVVSTFAGPDHATLVLTPGD
ncbi:MAG: thiolase family protein [Parahaliea sp.]